MSCPTCGHTLACIASQELPAEWLGIWHCERCGTLQVSHGGVKEEIYTPKLVDRCRNFRVKLGLTWEASYWQTSGIAEAINLPGERP